MLSCATCNEKEKLDRDWKEFLLEKVEEDVVRSQRVERIEEWVQMNGAEEARISQENINRVEAAANEIIEQFDTKVAYIRNENVGSNDD